MREVSAGLKARQRLISTARHGSLIVKVHLALNALSAPHIDVEIGISQSKPCKPRSSPRATTANHACTPWTQTLSVLPDV